MKKNKYLVVLLVLTFLFFAVYKVEAQSDELDLLSESIKNYHLNNYQKALELNNKIDLDKLTNNAKIETLYYRSLIQLNLGNISKGKETLTNLNEMGHDFGQIHYKLAKIYMNFYNNFDNAFYQTAIEEFKKARSLGVNSAQFHRDFALAYKGINDEEKAVQEFELAVKKDGNVNDYLSIANSYKKLGNLDKAENYYNMVINLDDKNETAYAELGDILLQQKKYKEAADILQEGVNINPQSFIMNQKLGEAHYYSDNLNKAEEALLKVIDLKDNYYRAHYYLGKLYEEQENYQNAKYYLNEATKYNPEYAQAYIALGDINLREGNNYQAISHYSTAIQQNPNYPKGHFHLSLAYIQADMKDAAISELRKTLHLSDSHDRAQELLDRLLEEKD